MRKYVAVFNNHFYLNGFIPFSKKEEFQIAFKNIRSVSCIVKPQDADPSLTPPVKLKNGWFSKPFESFVTMYGLPSHTDIDPTPLVANHLYPSVRIDVRRCRTRAGYLVNRLLNV